MSNSSLVERRDLGNDQKVTTPVCSHPYHDRMIEEVCDRRAFRAVRLQGNRIRVNPEDSRERTVGKMRDLDPDNNVGLLATLGIARTRLGDETLALAADDCLDAWAGFRAVDSRWEGSSRRRLLSCWLDHVGLTPDPAYADARVLAFGGAD